MEKHLESIKQEQEHISVIILYLLLDLKKSAK